MKVSFIINEPIQSASGGYKMVYIYANELVRRGIDVYIYYHCRKKVLFSNYKLPFYLKIIIANFIAYRGPKWFNLEKLVKRKIITKIDDIHIDKSDIIIATAADTAKDVYYLSEEKGEKYYFIQGYETWLMSREQLIDTYKLPMKKITVSKWLKKEVEKSSNDSVEVVLNGIDHNIFKIKIKPEKRKNKSICMLYHNLESKGSDEGLEVIFKLKERYKELEVNLFGVVDKPEDLPDWIMYTRNASPLELSDIYNRSMIYLFPSWNEGFGLTGAEAMMSGCALVSTETLGVKEYANETTARFVEIHDVDDMFKQCCQLFENKEQRCVMANKGAYSVSQLLDYNKAIEKFCKLVLEKK